MPENNKLIQTRVSVSVYKKIEVLARKSGASMATWLRQLLMKETEKAKTLDKDAKP